MNKNIGEIFITATRCGYKFNCNGSIIDIYDLWALSMIDLDSMYKKYSESYKKIEADENADSLFCGENVKNLEHKIVLENTLEIIRYVFGIKKEEVEAEARAAERKAQRNRIAELILKKKNEEFESLGLEELEKMLDDLND